MSLNLILGHIPHAEGYFWSAEMTRPILLKNYMNSKKKSQFFKVNLLIYFQLALTWLVNVIFFASITCNLKKKNEVV